MANYLKIKIEKMIELLNMYYLKLNLRILLFDGKDMSRSLNIFKFSYFSSFHEFWKLLHHDDCWHTRQSAFLNIAIAL